MIEAFPLQWPAGYPRTKFPSRARFQARFGQSVVGILHEIRLLGGTLPIISTNVPLRRDGLPYSGQAEPHDSGAAIYFTWKKRQVVLACDRWDWVTDNLRAVEKAIEAMRGLDRWGVSDMLDRAFAGFAALPAPESESKKQWTEILGVDPRDSLEVIETMYRSKAKRAHPDAGGSVIAMAALNAAIEEARKAKGTRA